MNYEIDKVRCSITKHCGNDDRCCMWCSDKDNCMDGGTTTCGAIDVMTCKGIEVEEPEGYSTMECEAMKTADHTGCFIAQEVL